MRDKTKSGLIMRGVLILALEGVRASGFEGEESFLVFSLHLLEIYPCTSKKKGNLVGKFKKSKYETLIFVSMEFSHLWVRKLS